MDTIRRTQQILISMLVYFHGFCQDHSLRYYALGGTVLGAVRHQGFIPWDDDIDIGMPRPDYERFIELFEKENNNMKYVLEGPYSDEPYISRSFLKLYNTQTTLIEPCRHPLKRGVFIDIFPLDGAGSDWKTANRLANRILFLIMISKIISQLPSKNILKRWIQLCAYLPCNLFFSLKIIRIEIDKISKTYRFDLSTFVANFSGSMGKREIVSKDVMGSPLLLPFEDTYIYCPQKTDEYLSRLYGDWRTPPPPDKRFPKHNCYIDLDVPYISSLKLHKN